MTLTDCRFQRAIATSLSDNDMQINWVETPRCCCLAGWLWALQGDLAGFWLSVYCPFKSRQTSASGSMWLFVHRFPVEIRNQCTEAIMFIVMGQTLVSITIWCQIKIKLKKLRATKETECGIWDILGNIPHFKVNTTEILVPSLLPLPLLLYLLTVLFLMEHPSS